jgi:hypothetical protein
MVHQKINRPYYLWRTIGWWKEYNSNDTLKRTFYVRGRQYDEKHELS